MHAGSVLSQIWTIARHSVVQAIRMRMVIVLIAFLFVLIPALPFILQSDSTHQGQVRLLITYSVYLSSFLLTVLTIFLSSITLNTEIKNQYIVLLDPKPIARGTLLAGKWLGVMLINFFLLAAMMGVSYGVCRYFSRPNASELPRPNDPPAIAEAKRAQYEQFKAEILTARGIARPDPPRADLGKWVDGQIAEIKEKHLMPEGRSEDWVRERLTAYALKATWQVVPNTAIEWTINGIPKTDERLLVKFRHYGTTDKTEYQIPGTFYVFDNGKATQAYIGQFRISTPHDFALPARFVGDDGSLRIGYQNDDQEKVSAHFPFEDGIQVLYPAGTLAGNFVRAGIVMLLRLAFITTVGVFASTFLSFPVAVLLTITVVATAHLSSFFTSIIIPDLYVFQDPMGPPGTPISPFDALLRGALHFTLVLFPDFSAYDVVPNLTDGYMIKTRLIGDCFIWLLLIRGGILAAAGWYIFGRRELAAVTPTT